VIRKLLVSKEKIQRLKGRLKQNSLSKMVYLPIFTFGKHFCMSQNSFL